MQIQNQMAIFVFIFYCIIIIFKFLKVDDLKPNNNIKQYVIAI